MFTNKERKSGGREIWERDKVSTHGIGAGMGRLSRSTAIGEKDRKTGRLEGWETERLGLRETEGEERNIEHAPRIRSKLIASNVRVLTGSHLCRRTS